MNSEYVIALYMRISEQDEDISSEQIISVVTNRTFSSNENPYIQDFQSQKITISNHRSNGESNSITGQRDMLYTFVRNHQELIGCKVLEFFDDGYSGTNFNRPGVTSLLNLAKTKEVDCIIVKDFSRFGRNYLEVGNFIEQVFPFLGVRFISVNDNFDSNKNLSTAGAIDVAFKNLIHDLYSKDISDKVTSVRKAKSEAGKFVTAFTPYGYMKSEIDKNVLIIDEECGDVVRRIFSMALQGIVKAEIARTLNAENILSPIMIRKQRKDNFRSWCANEHCYWTTATIAHILDDQRYVGDLIYGKTKPSAIGSGKDVRVPKEDWIVIPDAHTAIISREVFHAVNQMKRTNNYKYSKKTFPLTKKVYCGVCNHIMTRRANRSGKRIVYFCKTHWNTDKYKCFGERISEVEIEKAVLTALNLLIDLCNRAEFTQKKDKQERRNDDILKEIIAYERSLKQLKRTRLENYESYKAGQMIKEIFLVKQNQYEVDIEIVEKEMARLEAELSEPQKHKIQKEDIMADLKGCIHFHVLTKEIVDKFIDAVYIREDGSLKIKWTFSEPF